VRTTSIRRRHRRVHQAPRRGHGLDAKLLPQPLEFAPEGGDQPRLIGNDNILLIVAGGAARPVETAVQQPPWVKDCEFVVHVKEGQVNPHRNARCREPLDIRAPIVGLVVVANNANADTPGVRRQQCIADAIVGDREHADIGVRTRLGEEVHDPARTVIVRAEPGLDQA